MMHLFRMAALVAVMVCPGLCDEPSPLKQPANTVQSAFQQDVVGLWMMGQSLCEGAESVPVVTPTDSGWGNIMFSRGVRTWAARQHCMEPDKRPDDQFKFTPLTAIQTGGLGETIANGMADHLKSRLIASHSNVTQKHMQGPQLLVAYAGQGGRLIDELSSVDQSNDARTPENRRHGGGYYNTSLDDARRARGQAESLGKSFSIAALIWMQGEANGGPTGGINPSRWGEELKRPDGQEWYCDRLIAYRQQWSRDLKLITGQADDIPMFTYQTQGPAGEAQLMAADRDAKLTMVGPHYMIASGVNSRYASRYGDPIHMSADGERWYGEQVAKVIHRTLVDGEDWQPLRPVKVSLAPDRGSVVAEFDVPHPPLVLDKSFLAREQYPLGDAFHSLCGFQIRGANRAVLAMTAVQIESPTSVRIRLKSPVQEGVTCTLSYGQPYAGQLGKIVEIRKGPLRDAEPTTELVIAGPLDDRLKRLQAEGVFHVTNMESGDSYARAPIRCVIEAEGNIILGFENRERRNDKDFAVGQTLTALRCFSYGNLRDSDPEKAIYKFGDSAYGTRAGQSYPLWNWCVLFNRFPVVEE